MSIDFILLFQLSFPLLQVYQVLPVDHAGLGGSWTASAAPGLQHAEPAHPSKESELFAFGLQLQSQGFEHTKTIQFLIFIPTFL
jgi:hypothetical protein